MKQTYVNLEPNPIETNYIFPVEEESAMISFKAKIDGREIITKVKEKQEAKMEYDDAVNRGQTAVLLEEQKQDLFQMKVGQLKSNSKAEVEITYLMELPVEEDKVRLAVPTTICPR